MLHESHTEGRGDVALRGTRSSGEETSSILFKAGGGRLLRPESLRGCSVQLQLIWWIGRTCLDELARPGPNRSYDEGAQCQHHVLVGSNKAHLLKPTILFKTLPQSL
jgi:hypothetical protein